MVFPKKTYFNWSSGKDAAYAFYLLQQDKKYGIEQLVTSVNSKFNRVSMHGLRRELLEEQAKQIGLPLHTVELPEQPNMEEYNAILTKCVLKLQKRGYAFAGFGDIFLEDLRTYRENQLAPYAINCIFPLWKKNTKTIITDFLSIGFKSIVICIDLNLLDVSFLGRIIDKNFINDLPSNVDPCGENGEFHTFCFDGPIFKKPINFTLGEKVYREYKLGNKDADTNTSMGFWFIDLLSK